MALQLLVIDDHALFTDGLRHILARLAPEVTVTIAHDLASAEAALDRLPEPDLVLLDLDLGGESGLRLRERLRKAMLPFAILTASNDGGELNRACSAECLGLLPKSLDAEQLLAALGRILAGERVIDPGLQRLMEEARQTDGLLTARQHEVLALLAEGLPNKTIADRLGLTEITVKTHVSAIMQTLGARNRTDCIVQAMRRGLLGESQTD